MKPFHESVIDRLRAAHQQHGIVELGELLIITKIPDGHHDAVIAAWLVAAGKFRISPDRVEDALRQQQMAVAA